MKPHIRLKTDLLEGHQIPGEFVPGLVDDPVRSLPYLLYLHEVVHNLNVAALVVTATVSSGTPLLGQGRRRAFPALLHRRRRC